MRMYDIIEKKRDGGKLSKEEIEFFITGYTDGTIPDYQASALTMAIYFQGMDKEETAHLTTAMARSGDMVDLSAINGIKVDKHSTGGVGDKTTLIVAPIVAACGVPVAKMSGRGLGHTGGTVDKMESIPGLCTTIPKERFFEIVNTIGISVIGQSGNLAPADKKLYALRDVTATVGSLPLIASSIMSKKIAAGSDCILLDVKTGNGAFMKSLDSSIELAQEMVSIGEQAGRKTVALITEMGIPLGHNIGNSLEVIEAVETLQGHGPADLLEVCTELAANMLYLADKGDVDTCRKMVQQVIADGSALQKLKDMSAAQGGDISVLEDTSRFEKAAFTQEVKAPKSGYITSMQTEEIGIASVVLGAGRENKEDTIDFSAGIRLLKKYGEPVSAGETIAYLYSNKKESFPDAESKIINAIEIGDVCPSPLPLIHARVSGSGVERR